MKRRMLRLLCIPVILFSLIFSACTMKEEINEGGDLDPDGQKMTAPTEEYVPQETAAGISSAALSVDPGEFDQIWEALQQAREKMAGLVALEENQLLYTKKEDSEESITLRLTMTDIDSDVLTIAAVGSVKTMGNVIPLEIYYKNGVMLRASGGSSAREASTREQVLATVDFLQSIRRDLKKEDLRTAAMEQSVDGMITISLEFAGSISGLPTTGRGEIIIDSDGLISSEGYSFDAEGKDGKLVSQSVECTLLAVNGAVEAIKLPEGIE